jgi:predicted metalloprotease
LAVSVALALGACGGDDDSADSASDEPVAATEPVTSGQRPEGQQVLADLPQAVERAKLDETSRAARIVGTSDLSIEQYLEVVIKDVADFWARSFQGAGYQFNTISYAIVNAGNEPISAGCGVGNLNSAGTDQAGNFYGPFYCPNDNTVYLPAGWLEGAYGAGGGDFAVAFVEAHEVGHHIQNLLGTLGAKQAGQLTSKQVELQADCFAGVWARTIENRNLLESNDLDEAVRLAGQLGDVPGTPLEQEHGTNQERVAAFSNGFQTGDGRSCSY